MRLQHSSAEYGEQSAHGRDRAGTGRGQRGAGRVEEGRPWSCRPARVRSAQGAGFPAGPSRREAPPAKRAPLSPRSACDAVRRLLCLCKPRHPHGASERRCERVTAPGASARPPGSCTEPGARGPVLRSPQRSPVFAVSPHSPRLAAAAPGPWGCPLWSSAIRIWTARILGSDCSVTRSSWREPTSSSKSC